MEIRFIEYDDETLVVIGMAYETRYDPPECYVAVPLKDSITRTALFSLNSITIPFTRAIEITDPKRLKALRILYGK